MSWLQLFLVALGIGLMGFGLGKLGAFALLMTVALYMLDVAVKYFGEET